MQDDPNPVASEILYANLLYEAEGMMNTTYQAVEKNSMYATIYKRIAKRAEALAKNLERHALKQAWLPPAGRVRCEKVAAQARELAKFCRQYSAQANACANSLIRITEELESCRVLSRVAKDLGDKLDKKKG